MKRRGFTLVEILAVVAVIAILVTLLMPAIANLLVKTEEARARNEANVIANAIADYYATVGRLPYDPSLGCSETWLTSPWDDRNVHQQSPKSESRLNVERNMLRATYQLLTTTSNPARRVFLELPLDPDSGLALDPWGNPYMVMMDCGGSGAVYGSRGMRAVVRSLGPDGEYSPEGRGGSDDIFSRM